MRMLSICAICALIVLCFTSQTKAVTIVAQQTTAGNTAPTTPAVATDLFQTALASVSPSGGDSLLTGPAKYNGTTGTAHENSGTNPATITGTNTYDFNLNVVAFPLGYRIDEVAVYTGWIDFRAGQDFRAFYSLVGDPTFTQYADVNISHSDGTLRVSLTDSLGPIATNVDALRFIVDQSTHVYREIDVFGAGVTVPEPATAMLLLLASSVTLRRRRAA